MSKTSERIKNVVDNIEDVEEITASEIAKRSYTSNASVSRYIKSLGFEDFFSFRLALRKQGDLRKAHDLNIYRTWGSRLRDSFECIELDIMEVCRLMTNKKIFLWCKREYIQIANNFIALYTREGYTVVSIDHFFDMSQINKDDDIVLTIGRVPNDLYIKDLQYICIDYNTQNCSKCNNIMSLKVVPLRYSRYDTLNMNFRIACINLLLAIILEQMCAQDNLTY